MNKRILVIFSFICATSFYGLLAQNQALQVKDILKNPSAYMREEIEVTGLVVQYIEATEKTTSHYYLKDDYGAIIKVHTAEGKPETNVKYKVRGILYIDQTTQTPFISERSKSRIGGVITNLVSTPPPPPAKTWFETNWLLVVIVGSVFLLMVLIIILFARRRKVDIVASHQPAVKQVQVNVEKQEPPVARDNLKTMVIPSSVPKTMKFIPGEFEVVTGDDKGRIIKIGGYPTEEGSIVTIGRDQVTGPRDFAHIQLKERTISRRQAEIVLKDGKLYLKNLSETNYSKLDGKDIPPNTSAELKANSVLTFGEVEMKYKV
jgi:hypothetical protein